MRTRLDISFNHHMHPREYGETEMWHYWNRMYKPIIVPEPLQTPECTPDMVYISTARWASKQPYTITPIEHPMMDSFGQRGWGRYAGLQNLERPFTSGPDPDYGL